MTNGCSARWLPVLSALVVAATTGTACSSSSADNSAGNFGGGSNGAPGPTPGAGAAGGGGGSGGNGPIGVGGGGPIITPPDAGEPNSCASQSFVGEEVPLDMFIMMDRSFSMTEPTAGGATRWVAVKDALTTFVNSPESRRIGAGMQFFPQECPTIPMEPLCDVDLDQFASTSCNANDYASAAVPIAELPANAMAIESTMNATFPGGFTPTYPALQGAMQVALDHAIRNPGRNVIVVLATDGDPVGCEPSNQLNNISMVAAAGLSNNPAIRTFVVGIGNVANLDLIAQAGGTVNALQVTAANAGQDFLNAMNQIRGQALACEFTLPAPPDGEVLNPNRVNVGYTPPGGQAEVIGKVPGEPSCDAAQGGWYYDNEDTPTSIRICPASCDRILDEATGAINIELGCDTIPLVPK